MPNLSELPLKSAYHKGDDDIANGFYIPCMLRADIYNRAVGFFSSTVYILAWEGLKEFVKRGGKIKIICSPVLSTVDKQAINEGYSAKQREALSEELKIEIEKLFQNSFLDKPVRVLSSLITLGVVDIKIAVPNKPVDGRVKRIFHDKVGIFIDEHSNAVVFKGSMNESWTALSLDGNIESVDVFVSWDEGRDKERVNNEIEYFERLWKNIYPGVSIIDFTEVAPEIFQKVADINSWEHLVDEILSDISLSSIFLPDKKIGGRVLRTYQVDALLTWINMGRRGILEHATGSGKTLTALSAIRYSLKKGEIPLIFVPSELLLKQWTSEVKETLNDINPRILLCGGGNTSWREENLLKLWSKPSTIPKIIISINQTAIQPEFVGNLVQGEHLLIVADEVHRLGSTENKKLLQIKSGPRLGLSATPRRAGDPDGTKEIIDYFGGIVQPPFTLQDAVDAGALTPYFYYVHKVYLTSSEQAQWNEITKKIGKIFVRTKEIPIDSFARERIKSLLIQRSRIVKNAHNKLTTAVTVLNEYYKPGQKWLIYCDTKVQMHFVHKAILTAGMESVEYYSTMEGDRDQTLALFSSNGGIVVSIRCLDEGVDIPTATHALILASSKNPREFIQRRGRVLRRAIDKHLAYIHDTIVVPVDQDPDSPVGIAILEGEIVRAIEFGKSAKNPSAIIDLQKIALDFNLDIDRYYNEGFEDDENNDTD